METPTDVRNVEARLHQSSVLTLRQLCNDASDTVLKKWVATTIWRDSIDIHENGIASASQNCVSVDADAQW